MKNHADVFTIILMSLILTTAHAGSAKTPVAAASSQEPSDSEKAAATQVEADADKATETAKPQQEQKPAPKTAATPTPEDPKPGEDEDSMSDDDKATVPGGTIEDEKGPEDDKDDNDEPAETLKPVTPYKYVSYDKKEAEKVMPLKFRKKWIAAGVPEKALDNVLSFLLDKKADNSKIENDRMVIIDFTQPSTSQRLYILNLKTGNFAQRLAAHGKKTGNLYASEFLRSNRLNSLQSTPGFHKIGEVYTGRHGKSYRLDGLEDRNEKARYRDIVIHAAMYATTNFITERKKSKAYVRLGLSFGCPAVSPNTMDLLLDLKLTDALLYNFTVLDSGKKLDIK